MGSKKAAPTTGTSGRSATTRSFCSTITATVSPPGLMGILPGLTWQHRLIGNNGDGVERCLLFNIR